MLLRPSLVLTPEGLRDDLEVELAGGVVGGLRPRRGPGDGTLLLPGFVNAHSHAFQRGLRGHVQQVDPGATDDFWSWRERMYDLATSLELEGVYRWSRLAFEEMVLAGFTTVGEFHYLHHAPDGTPYDDPDASALAVVRAATDVGLRIVLLRVCYLRGGPGQAASARQRRFCDEDVQASLAATFRLAGRLRGHALASVGLAAHSVRAVAPQDLAALVAWGGVLHAHVDEQPAEVEACLRETGARPMWVFADAGLLSPRFTAVHVTWPDDEEIALLRAAGARVCACPTTELDLGDGFLPVERLGDVPVCVGTDSQARIDPFAEIQALEWHARARLGRRNVLTPRGDADGLARRLLAAGSAVGADALGLDTGRIRPGSLADLVAIPLNHPALRQARPLAALVFAGHPGVVKHVWVGGRRVVEDGRLVGEAAATG